MSERLLIAQRFQLLAKLGEGGTGSVWRAAAPIFGVQVAIEEDMGRAHNSHG